MLQYHTNAGEPCKPKLGRYAMFDDGMGFSLVP